MEIVEDDKDTVLVRIDVFVTMSRREYEELEMRQNIWDELEEFSLENDF